jgi:hypothetical protein
VRFSEGAFCFPAGRWIIRPAPPERHFSTWDANPAEMHIAVETGAKPEPDADQD